MARRPIGMKTFLLATAAVLAVTLSACGDDDSGATAADDGATAVSLDDLDGRAFGSVRVEGHRLVEATRILLEFDGEEISAEAGCNHLFGLVSLEDGTLTAREMGGTEMGCPQPLADQDVWLTDFLGAGATVALDGDTLTLTGGDVVIELVEEDVPDAEGDPDEPTADSDEGTVVE